MELLFLSIPLKHLHANNKALECCFSVGLKIIKSFTALSVKNEHGGHLSKEIAEFMIHFQKKKLNT